MQILGIHDGHTSSVCLLEDGVILASALEERFTRKKRQGSFPSLSLKWLFDSGLAKREEIVQVALAGLTDPITDQSVLSRSRHRLLGAITPFVPKGVLRSKWLKEFYLKIARRRETINLVCKFLKEDGISPSILTLVEHHEAHAATAFYPGCFVDPALPVLVITLDGGGDGIAGSVNICQEDKLTRVAEIPIYDSIGMVYTMVTWLLGLTPLEHEYKVMGLAPYAPASLANEAYAKLAKFISLSSTGLEFKNSSSYWGVGLKNKMQRELGTMRFDAIAAAVQQLFEDLVLRFILGWVQKTGIKRVALAGGCFMNVKLNGILDLHPQIEELFVFPSCGDESISIGAAFLAYQRFYKQSVEGTGLKKIQKLGPLYLGSEYAVEEIEKVLYKYKDLIKIEKPLQITKAVAQRLARDEIAGWFQGKAEYGARALGNRSILANPRNLWTAVRLNKCIKQRDFWMPFAPTILWEWEQKYLKRSKSTLLPYMMVACGSTKEAERDLPAALHTGDLSCRPQILREDWNPLYYELLKEFEAIENIGALLNTSFNLHGEPIVNSPQDALRTFLSSALDILAIGPFLVSKR